MSKSLHKLLNIDNDFPLNPNQKEELLNFSAVEVEIIWMLRNKKTHGKDIPEWDKICNLVKQKASDYWIAAINRT